MPPASLAEGVGPAASRRWTRRPEGSNWGDFGPDDQLGRLNLLTPERVRRAVAEVREGLVFCLSLPLDYPGTTNLGDNRHPPILGPTMKQGRPFMNLPVALDRPGHVDVFCDDKVEMCLQYSTQWDALAHAGQLFDADGDGEPEIVYYNGYRAGHDVVGPVDYLAGDAAAPGPYGARALGIEQMARACVQGRGVMVDLEAHFGREHVLVGYDALMRVMEADRVVVEEGDIVCIRTGTARMIYEMAKVPDNERLRHSCAKLDGRDDALLDWISASGLAAIACDNIAVEASPSRPCTGPDCSLLPLHAHCLFKLGIPLGEMWDLGPLADWLRAHARTRFLLTAPPLRLPGAVGSPVTPVATV
jgi:kynurenine formamidase